MFLRRSTQRIELRALFTIALFIAFLFYPWASSGPKAFDSSDPRLVFVSPSVGGGAVFDQSDKQVNLFTSLTGASPRLDMVSSESSFAFETDAEILEQTVSPPTNWNWASVHSYRPWNAAFFNISVQAGLGVSIDIAAIRVTDASDPSRAIFQTDFPTSSYTGWTLENNATFQVNGSPPLPSLHLSSNGPSLESAQTSIPTPINGSVEAVFVSALVRFDRGPGAFKVDLTWLGANGVSLGGDATDWENWRTFFSSPSVMVLKIWHPEVREEVHLSFRPFDSSSGNVSVEIAHRGVLDYRQRVAEYHTGERFHISANWNWHESLDLSVKNDSGLSFVWSSASIIGLPALQDLVDHRTVALSILLEGVGLTADDLFQNPIYLFPGSGRFADLAQNYSAIFVASAFLGLMILTWLPDERSLLHSGERWLQLLKNSAHLRVLKEHAIAEVVLGLVALFYFVIALQFGGHPFDTIVFKTWIYGGQVDGLQGIYARTSSVGDSAIHGDNFPWSALGFAYEPLAAYLFLLMSKTFPSFSPFNTQSVLFSSATLEATIKWSLGLVTLGTAAVMYSAILKLTGSKKHALLTMGVFVLNPAIVYDSVVWGETDALLYLAFLLFALFARKRPSLAIITFAIALALKQTGIILLLPTLLLLLRPGAKISRQLGAIGKSTGVLFASLIPLIVAGLLPTAFSKPLITKLSDIGISSGVVSPDTYTFWTIFTPLSGGSGLMLLQYPSGSKILWDFSFALLGYVSFSIIVLAVFGLGRRAQCERDPAFWHAVVGFTSVAFVSLITGAASRYYTLAIPGLTMALSLGWNKLSPRLRLCTLGSLVSISVVALWTMAGLFTVIMSHENIPIRGLELDKNPLMQAIFQYYTVNFVVLAGSISVAFSLFLSSILVLRISKWRPASSAL